MEYKIGLVGCDTSHCVAFARILNDPKNEHHLSGGRIVAAYPGGSPDFELSVSRLDGFVKELRETHQVEMLDSIGKVGEACDAVLLTSVDGRIHLEQFKELAGAKKPVFIDKPFALTVAEAREITRVASENGVVLMSCSSLRYADGFVDVLNDTAEGAIFGADFYGPMALQETQPGLFWYGIHTVEMLYATMGRNCMEVRAFANDNHDQVTGIWADGRLGTIRGNRLGNSRFGGVVHREKGSRFVDVYASGRPYYVGLLENILKMLETGKPPIELEETVEIVNFIVAANRSRETGKPVKLADVV